MPLFTTDALILRTFKLGESDRIVVFLTRDRGKKRGVAKNARQSRRRSSSSGLGALTIAQTRGSPRLYAKSVRSSASASMLSVFALRRVLPAAVTEKLVHRRHDLHR